MYRILIVEDELIERTVLKKTLEKNFGDVCEIYDAENGTDALNVFRNTDINIVILDIQIPGTKGIELAEIFRNEKKGFVIIFLTAYDKFEYAKRAIAVHALEYLLKPYSNREIISVVEQALHLLKEYQDSAQLDLKPYLEKTDLASENIDCNADKESHMLYEEETRVNRFNVLMSMVEEYLRANYRKDISVQDIARAIGYSEPYFCTMFKQQFGTTFTVYLMEYRIEEAKKLLQLPDVNVKEIGVRVGYPDSTYFARVFRRITGESPSDYRSRCLKSL